MSHSFSRRVERGGAVAAAQVIRELLLDEHATMEECALARNKFTRERLLSDFYDGITEMRHNGGRTRSSTHLPCKKEAAACLESMGCHDRA
jgi:hypothetical protein